jgi:hypothetical protein
VTATALHADLVGTAVAPVQVVLALDLASTCGWAMRTPSGNITSGSVAFHLRPGEGPGLRFLRFRRWLIDCKAGNEIGRVYYEQVRRHLSTDSAHCYGGFFAIMGAWCEANAIPYRGVPVGTIKKHATGRGNAKKGEMVEAMRLLGYDPADDNEADSLALLHYALDVRPR